MPEPTWLSAWELQRRYGPVTGSPTEAARIFGGAPFVWWVAGGWSLETGAAPARGHEDVDVVILDRDSDAARSWLADWHVWEATGEGLRALTPGRDRRPDCQQWWLRRDAYSPWVTDVLLTPSDGADWLFKRDHRVRRPLSDVVEVRDAVPYQVPEVTLLHKAAHSRHKDVDDLERVWPTLTTGARTWLRDALALAHPDSPWAGRLDAMSR